MKRTTTILMLAVLVVVLAPVCPTGYAVEADGVSEAPGETESRSVQFGLGIRVDADWISLNGTWSLDANRNSGAGHPRTGFRVHEVRIGAVPNMIRQAQKGLTLIRALRTTYICLAKQWLDAQNGHHGPQGQ